MEPVPEQDIRFGDPGVASDAVGGRRRRARERRALLDLHGAERRSAARHAACRPSRTGRSTLHGPADQKAVNLAGTRTWRSPPAPTGGGGTRSRGRGQRRAGTTTAGCGPRRPGAAVPRRLGLHRRARGVPPRGRRIRGSCSRSPPRRCSRCARARFAQTGSASAADPPERRVTSDRDGVAVGRRMTARGGPGTSTRSRLSPTTRPASARRRPELAGPLRRSLFFSRGRPGAQARRVDAQVAPDVKPSRRRWRGEPCRGARG